MKGVLWLDGGDGCTTKIPLNRTLKNGYCSKFYVYFTRIKKKFLKIPLLGKMQNMILILKNSLFLKFITSWLRQKRDDIRFQSFNF